MGLKSYVYKKLMSKRVDCAERERAVLASATNRKAREAIQVDLFNKVWKTARENVPFYTGWQQKHALPDEIRSLEELNRWPILTKADLRNLGPFVRKDVDHPRKYLVTGGSTGEPVRLPTFGDETVSASQVYGRSRYGVHTGDRTFLLWGHEHLYGKGFRRKINILKRRLKDWLANWTRVSAYDLGEEAMTRAYAIYKRKKPAFVLGYSAAVLAFCRINRAHRREVGSVRVVLCSAGPLTPAEKAEIEDFFGAKVAMEYGSVECGIMAYTRPADGRYDVFWNTHLIQAERDNGEYRCLVTRLTECYVPMIRYDIGDYLKLNPEEQDNAARSVLEIDDVKGRPSEMIHFACGASFFGALIGDCIKQIPSVIQSQMEVDPVNNMLQVSVVTSGKELSDSDKDLIKGRILLTVQDANKLTIRVVQVPRLKMTVGGKIPRIVFKEER